MTSRNRVILQLLSPLIAVAITSVLLFAWFSLQERFREPAARTGLAGVEPVAAFTDPFIPDPRGLPDCARPDSCEEIPEAAWPQVREVRDSLFLACPDGTLTRRGGEGAVHAFVQYRGLKAIASSRDQMLYLGITYDAMRLGNPGERWTDWQHNGDGGGRRRESLARLSRSSLTQWHAQPRSDLRPVDFGCADLPG